MALFGKAIGLLTLTLMLSTIASAQQSAFRVDTKVLIEPVKQTLTLFSEGVCYDFALDESAAITLIDPARNRILLLDPVRQVKTTLDMRELLSLVASARQEAARGELASLLESAKNARYDELAQTVTVGDERMEYQATLQKPAEKNMAAQYAVFADWSARLNAVYSPHLPPYLRLELNRLVAAQGMLPQKITRTTQHQGQQFTIQCELSANWRISTEDEKEIRRVGAMLTKFNEVSASDYFKTRQQIGRTASKLAQ